VLAMSAGYELVDRLAPHRKATQRENCGGPDGGSAALRNVSPPP
jgi:hypothetical protein